jgi:membrane protein required for colicin V production
MPTWISDLNGVDAALLAALAVSLVLGALRGFVFEVMTLAGWVVAYAAAYLLGPRLLPLLPSEPLHAGQAVGAQVMPLLAFVLCFAGVLIGWNLLAHLVRLLVRATPLSGIDRLLGAVFGFARGMLLLLAVVVIVELTPWARAASWQASLTVPQLEAVLAAVKPLLPPGVARWLAR